MGLWEEQEEEGEGRNFFVVKKGNKTALWIFCLFCENAAIFAGNRVGQYNVYIQAKLRE